MWLYHRVMSPNDADGIANSVLFAQGYLSENLGSLRYVAVGIRTNNNMRLKRVLLLLILIKLHVSLAVKLCWTNAELSLTEGYLDAIPVSEINLCWKLQVIFCSCFPAQLQIWQLICSEIYKLNWFVKTCKHSIKWQFILNQRRIFKSRYSKTYNTMWAVKTLTSITSKQSDYVQILG